MKAASLNQFQSNLIVDELVRCGVGLFCISPGSRNAPLVIAAANHPKAETQVHFDERGAGFYAVGYAKGSGKPAVLICTSGTAVTNYLPAVVEAYESQTPLVLLTADRPFESLDSDTNQTIDQRGIFGRHTNHFADIHLGDATLKPEFLLSTTDQAFALAMSPDPGPVHINCRYREPLAPIGTPIDFSDALEGLRGWVTSDHPHSKRHLPDANDEIMIPELVVEKLMTAKRGVIVVGVLPNPQIGTALLEMANQWKWPLISDICSQTRFASPQSKQVISFADNYLRFEEVAESLEPDVVLQFGRTPISKFITGYSARASNAYVVVAPGTRRIDPHHRVTDRVSLDYSAAVSSLRQIKPQSSQLLPRLQEFEQMARELIDEWYANSADVFLGSNVVSEVCSAGESARAIYLSTSMPIREANGFARGRNTEIRVCANRGVNGIDGTIAAAVGYARATQRHTTLVIGDLAVLHDLNSLALVRGSNIPLTIVILNNDGGEIFSYLPIAKIGAHFEEFFRTPHQLGFAHAADMFGVKFYQPLNLRDFSTIYRHTLRSDRSVIIEVRIDRDRNVIQHREFWESLHDRALKCTQSRDDLA